MICLRPRGPITLGVPDSVMAQRENKARTMISISELKPTAFDDDGTPYADFRDLLDQKMVLTRVVGFENDKGKGVVAWLKDAEGAEVRVCTHSLGITDTLTNPAVVEALDAGEEVEVTFKKKKSTKSGREFFYCA